MDVYNALVLLTTPRFQAISNVALVSFIGSKDINQLHDSDTLNHNSRY